MGGFRFYGLIIVRGELRTAGTGGHFNGTVLAANVAVGGEMTSQNTVSGNATFRYSSCALMSALARQRVAGGNPRSLVGGAVLTARLRPEVR